MLSKLSIAGRPYVELCGSQLREIQADVRCNSLTPRSELKRLWIFLASTEDKPPLLLFIKPWVLGACCKFRDLGPQHRGFTIAEQPSVDGADVGSKALERFVK